MRIIDVLVVHFGHGGRSAKTFDPPQEKDLDSGIYAPPNSGGSTTELSVTG